MDITTLVGSHAVEQLGGVVEEGEGKTPLTLIPLGQLKATVHKKTPFSVFSIFASFHIFFGIYFYKIKTRNLDLLS